MTLTFSTTVATWQTAVGTVLIRIALCQIQTNDEGYITFLTTLMAHGGSFFQDVIYIKIWYTQLDNKYCES